ncbi:MAG: Sec-independent protein translocase subunit TatA [Pseudohongiella sp.]|nr:Sec-independent protein translocase subunit TatA [Pseudohongiella sp.]MDP1756934.1 Sec-independent protein translocase subunit TatA [Pseudohongiella sp.]MDP3516710.1 Sec-independent protein translocase subunit TatA [Pseudohongiella sp.]
MGIGGISIWQLLIIALIIVLLFGTKKLRTLGSDLGGALKGFKQAVKDDDKDAKSDPDQLSDDSTANANVSARTEKAQDK